MVKAGGRLEMYFSGRLRIHLCFLYIFIFCRFVLCFLTVVPSGTHVFSYNGVNTTVAEGNFILLFYLIEVWFYLATALLFIHALPNVYTLGRAPFRIWPYGLSPSFWGISVGGVLERT